MRIFWTVAMVVLFSLPFGCSPNPEAGNTPEARPTMSNADLENKIETALNSDPQLRAAKLDISADAERNTATLSGVVESEMMRTQAVQMAKNAHPGLVVEDKIDVEPRELSREEYTEEHARQEREKARESNESIGSSLDDAWIHSKIVTKLMANMTTPERKINVDVKNNVVTLRGTVETAEQKMEAERVAKETDGVKRVISQLKVSKG